MDVELISRAAALEVIAAVKGFVWSQSGKVTCGKIYSQVKDLPAVDAIPVEWLEERRDKLSEAWDEEWHEINGLIEQWHEEQEAGE